MKEWDSGTNVVLWLKTQLALIKNSEPDFKKDLKFLKLSSLTHSLFYFLKKK